MGKLIDLTGKTFGRLTVVGRASDNAKAGQPLWNCRCVCGSLTTPQGGALRGGRTQSCGCLAVETMRRLKTTHGLSRYKKEFSAWGAMRRRSADIDPRWQSFAAFFKDMGRAPSQFHILGRKDVKRNYGPANCMWMAQGRVVGWNEKLPAAYSTDDVDDNWIHDICGRRINSSD